MAIKSDRWIQRAAKEYGMIEPFAPEQVREDDGQKIISQSSHFKETHRHVPFGIGNIVSGKIDHL